MKRLIKSYDVTDREELRRFALALARLYTGDDFIADVENEEELRDSYKIGITCYDSAFYDEDGNINDDVRSRFDFKASDVIDIAKEEFGDTFDYDEFDISVDAHPDDQYTNITISLK